MLADFMVRSILPIAIVPSTLQQSSLIKSLFAKSVKKKKMCSMQYHHLQSLSHVQLFCEPVDCSLPDFSIHGILQARILEWVAISFSSFMHIYHLIQYFQHPTGQPAVFSQEWHGVFSFGLIESPRKQRQFPLYPTHIPCQDLSLPQGTL